MKKIITFLKLLVTSFVLSLTTIVVGGFPVFFYLPAGDDYGASFYEQEFLINTTIIIAIVLTIYLVTRKIKSRSKELV